VDASPHLYPAWPRGEDGRTRRTISEWWSFCGRFS